MRVAGPGLNHSQLMEEFDVCMEPPFPAVGGNGGLQGHIARHLLGIYPQACRQLRDYEGLRGKGRKRLQGTTRDPKNMGRRTTRERVATLAANQPAEEPKSVLQYSSVGERQWNHDSREATPKGDGMDFHHIRASQPEDLHMLLRRQLLH